MSPATHNVDVDPYEALVNLARVDPSIAPICNVYNPAPPIGDGAFLRHQVDMRHHYGQEHASYDGPRWEQDSQGLTFTPSGGSPELYVRVHAVTFEARCYGDTNKEAWAVYKALMEMCRVNGQRVIPIAAGNALVYWVKPLIGPRLIVEPEVRPSGGMPCWVAQLKAEVSEDLVG